MARGRTACAALALLINGVLLQAPCSVTEVESIYTGIYLFARDCDLKFDRVCGVGVSVCVCVPSLLFLLVCVCVCVCVNLLHGAR